MLIISMKFVHYNFERYSVKMDTANQFSNTFELETIVGLVPRSPNIQGRNKFRASYTRPWLALSQN